MPASSFPRSLGAFLLGNAAAAPGTHSTRERGWLFKGALAVFAGAIGFSIAGMVLLLVVPASKDFFGPYLQTLVVAPTWAYMALLGLLPLLIYGPLVGWRRALLFAALGCAIGGGSELVGTNVGLPFGEYLYTGWLGPKIAGDVPYFIPPSWFAMSLLSLDLAQRVTGPSGRTRWRRILLATTFMVLWDVSLDPAMNGAGVATSPFSLGMEMFWTYPPADAFKFYYGMPLSNWLGWFAVTFLIVCTYEFVAGGLPTESRWAPPVYLLNCLFPIVLCAMYGLFIPAAVGAVAAAIPLAAAYRAERRAAEREDPEVTVSARA
jgi:putative membrane protein